MTQVVRLESEVRWKHEAWVSEQDIEADSDTEFAQLSILAFLSAPNI